MSDLYRSLVQAHARRGEVIPRRPTLDPARLSFVQERMWLLEQVHAGTAMWHMPRRVRLRGPLDPVALAAAFRISRGDTRSCAPACRGIR